MMQLHLKILFVLIATFVFTPMVFAQDEQVVAPEVEDMSVELSPTDGGDVSVTGSDPVVVNAASAGSDMAAEPEIITPEQAIEAPAGTGSEPVADPAASDAATGEEGAAHADAAIQPEVTASINPNEIPTLLFTYWEYSAIQDAKKSRGSISENGDAAAALQEDFNFQDTDEQTKPPPEKRDIKLGGIVYKSSKDWTIWLNGQRITPGALPREVIDLKVYEGYVEVKWYDAYTKKILPIRLRPHQRFNIDTRIFLPG